MKAIKSIIGLSILTVLFTLPLMAQITNNPEGTVTPKATNSGVLSVPLSEQPLPRTMQEIWTWGIAFVVPLIVGGFKKLVPSIPNWLLPVSTPFLGIGLGLILNALSASGLAWMDMAQAGGLAVVIRESFNQIVTKRMQDNPQPAISTKD